MRYTLLAFLVAAYAVVAVWVSWVRSSASSRERARRRMNRYTAPYCAATLAGSAHNDPKRDRGSSGVIPEHWPSREFGPMRLTLTTPSAYVGQ